MWTFLKTLAIPQGAPCTRGKNLHCIVVEQRLGHWARFYASPSASHHHPDCIAHLIDRESPFRTGKPSKVGVCFPFPFAAFPLEALPLGANPYLPLFLLKMRISIGGASNRRIDFKPFCGSPKIALPQFVERPRGKAINMKFFFFPIKWRSLLLKRATQLHRQHLLSRVTICFP